MSAFSLRDFRPEDATLLEGIDAIPVAFGRTLMLDGSPVGYGGVFEPFADGQPWLFFHIKPSVARRARVTLCRACLAGLEDIRLRFGAVAAYCDHRKPRAAEFLRWMGFANTRGVIVLDGVTFEIWRLGACDQ
jgi:hypothetical protein